MPHDNLYYSYCIYQHLSSASWENQPLTSKGWPFAISRPWCSSVEHNLTEHQHQMRPLCDYDEEVQHKIRSLLITSEYQKRHGHGLTTKMTKHPLILATPSDCCFFTNHSLNLGTSLPSFSTKFIEIPNRTVIPTSWQ